MFLKRFLLVMLLLVFLAACAPSTPADSGIAGQVFLGPVCPVVQLNNPCPDRPYQASLTSLTSSGRKVTSVTTDTEGRFRVALAPGNYTLHPEKPANSPMPFAAEQTFSVIAAQFTQVKVTYDSGIR